MTDNEIIKALECCVWVRSLSDCLKSGCPARKREGCSYFLRTDDVFEGVIFVELIKDAIDLINRQKARIKKRESDFKSMQECARYFENKCETAKTEAIKEFAERSEKEIFIKQDDERKQMLKILKTYRRTRTYSDTEQATDNWLRGYGEAVQDILCVFDNLLKEMVGDNNA